MTPPFRPHVDGPPVDWPDTFGTRFTLFVDTEEEFDWNAPLRRDGWGVSAMAALPQAHARFATRGVEVGYLVDYPVVTEPLAIDAIHAILATGHATLGAQLHPWVNPPFAETLTPADSFAGNLPREVEAAKLDRLTHVIQTISGTPPLVYRAGRYGIGPATLALLAERGYRIDSSMRSRYCYAAEGGPDFSAIGNTAFRTGPGGALLELPLTSVFTGHLRRRGQRLYHTAGHVPRGRGLLARTGLLHRVALTPEDMPLDHACEAIRIATGEGVRLLNLSYHSPSVVPGHTPYVRDATDLAAFWRWWDGVLDLLDRRGIRSASTADVLAAAG
ncbi:MULTISPECIES: polysaccharide deacetylase family protein [unclassified Sphingomonas]|uniref:polysaccharide deacetylase family protein n=1 Tax=unclassified Sphingomonas TaxID=196159 RepID=UPI0007013E0D|nr:MULTISPECIES: polysaccharide deacetylase family protein [unclassified Sphingomonas]KQM97536.1 WalW protein [Sphingomonas sp. Leaf25]